MIKTIAATTPMLVEAWKKSFILTLDESLTSTSRKPFINNKYHTLAKYIKEKAQPSDVILLLSPKTSNGYFVSHAIVVDGDGKVKFDTNRVNSSTLYAKDAKLYRRTYGNDKTWFRVAATIEVSEFLSENNLSHLLERKQHENKDKSAS